MEKRLLLLIVFVLLFALEVSAAQIFAGYGKIPWGADAHSVASAYPKGKMMKMGPQDVYRQDAPSRDIKQRSFAFVGNKLVAVSVTYSPEYVKKSGIEKLLAAQQKRYGQGTIDRSGAPHMVTYRWQGKDIRITFAYAPKRPEMTVLMYEKK